MQTINTIPAGNLRPVSSYIPEMASGAVTAIKEPKASSADSTTVNLSHKAIDRYATDKNEAAVQNEEQENPVKQAKQEVAAKVDSQENSETDSIAETLEHLQELLKEAQQRLRVAQQQMTQAMAEMKNAKDESGKMAAMMKVKTTQMLVISAQGEVLEIYAQINKILEEQQKLSKGSS